MKNASSNSEFVACVARYLGYPPETPVGEDVLQRIDRAIEEVEQLSSFHYIYAHFTEPLGFMLRNDAYMKHLSGAEGFLLCATTLGAQVDRHLKRLELTDMSYAIVFDAVASAYLEFKADEYERALPYPNRGFRFCPGYGSTPLEDSRDIVTRLRADRVGITFLDSGLMVPMKSMAGIIKLGGESRKSCEGCVARTGCVFRERGTRCYRTEE